MAGAPTRFRARPVIVALWVIAGCSGRSAAGPTNSQSTVRPTAATSSTVAIPVLTEADTTEILALGLRAGVLQDPSGRGIADGQTVVVADALGEARDPDVGVRFDRSRRPLSAADRAAIEAAMLPSSVTFTSPDSDVAMWQLAQPVFDGDAVVLTYQNHCGGEANMCDSGGAFQLQRQDASWRIAQVVSNWIA